ncbi:MAG: hypothetical protein HXS41_15220 [Theionarchaea archaeon]|nr:hypothetical protein [Theionarchaea archaeon]MBU6999686.1 hypothetical protein [Theionarchaea archaeon]MBU7022401.1 hypothetical protein [Theionarchaea archaeon]MBU7035846.1 hypothetical protein [Theionarchaea archaeon]MBU7041831.1 hypothetical protein [Theionarchaea archaeon]
MTSDMNLKELERKAWTAYFDDGILDISIGLFVLTFGIGMTTQYSALTALAWMVVFFFAAAKKSITLPRVGLVTFSPEREERMKKEKSFFVVFFSITALLGLVFFLVLTTDLPQSVRSMVGEMALVGYELIIAVAIFLVGYWKQIRRFYVYAGFFLVVIVAGVLFDVPGVNPLTIMMYQFIGAGGLILLSGFIVLARFFRRYPGREGGGYVAR